MPTQDVVEYWINSLNLPSTMKTYRSTIKSFFAWVNKDLKSVTPFDAINFNSYSKEEYAEATVQNRISTLNEFFKFCMECGIITKNPFAVVKQKGASNRCAEKFLTPKEIKRLLTALRETKEKRFILGLILVSTGLRISEAHGLSWSSFIEMPDQTISVNVLRKGNEYQLLPIREDVWTTVKQYMGREIDQSDHSPLFLNATKSRASVVTLRAWIIEGGKRAGITRHTNPHILRHSFATTTLDRGADIRDLSWYLNHKNLASTQVYAHPTNRKVGEFMPIDI
jgi:site-specific recombinase XerD